jgi:pantetheine-phosphate adenylyltransferase
MIYPGSFDPITNGHLEIIERASKLCDELIVLISHNINKKSIFNKEERIELIALSTSHLKNIKIDYTEELLVTYAKKNNCNVIIKGFRTFNDYEYEYAMATYNNALWDKIETLVMFPSLKNQFVSSTNVKELAMFKADISAYVPSVIVDKITKKINKK